MCGHVDIGSIASCTIFRPLNRQRGRKGVVRDVYSDLVLGVPMASNGRQKQ